MNGLHLTADLSGCAPLALLTDEAGLARGARLAAEAAGLSIVGGHWHRFPAGPDGRPGGITGMLLLAESHVALHTWPEIASVTLDVYVCNYGGDNSMKARALMAALLALFEPESVQSHELQRGRLGVAADGAVLSPAD